MQDADLEGLLDAFKDLPDPRSERNCQDRCKNPQNNRAKIPQAKRSKVGYFSFRLVTGSGEEDERSLSLRR